MRSLEQRFLEKVDFSGECWVWLAAKDGSGYGSLRVGGRSLGAHTVSYALYVGPVPAGSELDHTCRVRACVRPTHLEPVTHVENMRRIGDNHYLKQRTECPRGHRLEGENLGVSAVDGEFRQRYCKTCKRERRAVAR